MPNAVSNVSFASPGYDYGAELEDIQRKRALAQALQNQSMESSPTQVINGWAVRQGPMSGVSKLVQAIAGATGQEEAKNEQKDLAQRAQADYRQMLSTGLRQLQGTPATAISEDASGNVTPPQPAIAPDPAAALGTFASHPMGQQFTPLVMQELQQQKLMEALKRMGGQGQPQQPSLPPMQPGHPGSSVMAGGPVPQGGAGGAVAPGGPASGIPMEAWLMTDPTGKSYLQHLSEGGKTSGRVFYDQQGKAFTVAANGSPIYLNGITARDKPEAVNLGGSTRFVNPYQAGGQQFQHTPTIGNQIEATNTYHNTGMNPLNLGGMTPPNAPSPGGQPTPQTPPGQRPAQASPNARLTPKQQQELEQARPHQTQAAQNSIATIDNSMQQIVKLRQQPGLSNITGPIAGRTPNLTGSATNAQANLDTLKAQIGVHTLTAMREASKTGGAVGNVTEKEWPILQSQLGALQQAQTTAQFEKSLDDVEASLRRIKGGILQAYESTYGKMPMIQNTQGGQDDPLGLRR